MLIPSAMRPRRLPFHPKVRQRRELENRPNASDVEKRAGRRTMKLFLTFVAIARNRVGRTSGLWVILTFSAAIYSVSADTILLKSGETLRGQITSESDLSVTISTETSTGKTDKTIAKTEIVGRTLSSAPASPTPTSVSPDKHWEYKRGEIVNAGTAQVVLDLG